MHKIPLNLRQVAIVSYKQLPQQKDAVTQLNPAGSGDLPP